MHYFHFAESGELYCEEVKIKDIAEKFKTPLYIYSTRTILEHYKKLHEAFSNVKHLICYSLKANSNLSICNILAKCGGGADVVSGGEIYKAIKAGINPNRIVYAGVGKTEYEIEYALKLGILMFNVESLPEAYLIHNIAKRLKKKARVAIRVNPDIDPLTHSYITTGRSENKFGVNIMYAKEYFLEVKKLKNLEITGIHIHIGSQITKLSPYVQAIKKAIKLLEELKQLGIKIAKLDIGGGLGIIYNEEKPSSAKDFADLILPLVKKTNCEIILEPGRFIVGNAGILVTKVLYLKETNDKKFVIVDAGMNDLIRPSLYGAYHQIVPVNKNNKEEITADIVGPICESGDFFAMDRRVHKVNSGDLLAIMSAGAYGFSMSSNYNARPKPAEVIVKGKEFFLARKRETYSDLIKGEKII